LPLEMTTAQKAMRLFAVLIAGAEPNPADPSTKIFKGEVRLNALMFWLRNPDYLAWELLDLFEQTRGGELVFMVRQMLDREEPVLRRDAMLKWRFGAYEPMDDEMAILSSRGLVRPIMKPASVRSAGNDFVLSPTAFELAESLRENAAYKWYAERMQIVMRLAGTDGGSALKERQYKHFEYFSARPHEPIPPIESRLLKRLAVLEAVA
jgi:hypothetical protein